MTKIGLLQEDVNANRTITVLRPTRAGTEHAGKRYVQAEDGRITTEQTHGTWFSPTTIDFNGLIGLHDAFEAIAFGAYGHAFVVRGCPVMRPGQHSCTRRMHGGKTADGRYLPQGIQDTAKAWAVLDFDGLPNPHHFDPRDTEQGEQAISWLVSLLPAPAQDMGFSWAWSSSCCVKNADGQALAAGVAPVELRLHMRVMLDTDMAGMETRDMLKAIDGHVRARIVQDHGSAPGHVLDAATGTCQQPVYVMPTFMPPLLDPMPMTRSGYRMGITMPVSAVLAACLPAPVTPRGDLLDIVPAKTKVVSVSVSVIPQAATVMVGRVDDVTLDAFEQMTRDMQARVQPRGKAAQYRAFANSALRDIDMLVQARMGIAGSAWEHGIPAGSRTLTLLIIGTLARHAGQSPTDAMDVCRRYATSMCNGGGHDFWMQWQEKTAEQVRGASAHPGKEKIMELFSIGADDMSCMSVLVDTATYKRRLNAAAADKGQTTRGSARKRDGSGDAAATAATSQGVSRATVFRQKAKAKAVAMKSEQDRVATEARRHKNLW